MRLTHSSSSEAFKSNLKAELSAGKKKDQALAIAYSIKRRAKRANGGASPPWYVKSEARQMVHTGPIHSTVPGRTDHLKMNVPTGAYILPADHISGLGQGNTSAGQRILQNMFSQGPYGSPLPKGGKGRGLPKPPKLADGGDAEGESPATPILAAGGEFVIPPEVVAQIGGGDLDYGHKLLDRWVVDTRKKHVKTLRKLPGPSK